MPSGIYLRSEYHKQKIRQAAIKKGFGKWMIGKKQSIETNIKRSKTAKKNNVGKWMKRKKFSKEIRQKMSIAHKKRVAEGKHNNYKGGITSKNNKIRASLEYRLWREAIFERDNYTCQICGQRGGKIIADHILPFAYFPAIRLALNNGRTLCKECHKKTDTYQNKAKRFEPIFVKWIKIGKEVEVKLDNKTYTAKITGEK
jgi:HNH endonuclease